MAERILKCPECNTTPEVVKFWHDKENRALNHLPYGTKCQCGPIARASSRREVIYLSNGHMEYLSLPTELRMPPTRWERFLAWFK